MAILTTINGIPLFSTQQEALSWGASRGLEGFHTHQYLGQTGYMGGIDHSQALTNNPVIIEQPIIEEQEQEQEQIINTPVNNNSFNRTTGGGGSGGGGGY